MNKKLITFILISLILMVGVYLIMEEPQTAYREVNVLDISHKVNGQATIQKDTIVATGNFTYGNRDITSVLRELQGYYFIKFSVSTNKFSFGHYSILFNIGSMKVGIVDDALGGLMVVVDQSVIPLSIRSGNDYTIQMIIKNAEIDYFIQTSLINLNYTFSVKNLTTLARGVPQEYFMSMNETGTDIATMKIYDIESGTTEITKVSPLAILLMEIAVFLVIWSFYFNLHNFNDLKFVLIVLIIGIILIFMNISDVYRTYLFITLSVGFGAILFSLKEWKETEKVDMPNIVIGLFVTLSILFLIGSSIAESLGVNFTIRTIKSLAENLTVYDFLLSLNYSILLIAGILSLLDRRKIFIYVGSIEISTSIFFLSYFISGNLWVGVFMFLYSIMQILFINADRIWSSRWSKMRYAQLILTVEGVIFAYLTVFH